MTDFDLSTDIITDSNHYMRRFFRCWLDGSYNGEGHYISNCNIARENWNSPKRLRAHVISEWCQYMARENDCSISTVQRHMVKEFTGCQIEALNNELIEDLKDLIIDQIEVA